MYIHNRHYEESVQFTWDAKRSRRNRHMHGISLETAALIFDDPYHISVQDREVDGEMRWQTIGMAGGLQVLVVAHTVHEEAEEIRIISRSKSDPPRANHLCRRLIKKDE